MSLILQTETPEGRALRALSVWLYSVASIKDAIADGDLSAAAEAWEEIPHEDQIALWRAPSKGGPWTAAERKTMKSPEFLAECRNYKETTNEQA